jgi:glycosyltransferase involved in cell wall biosynthesis
MGSEPGNTWNLAVNLAAQHQVWVLTQSQHRRAIEEHLARWPNPRLQIIFVTIKPWMDPWNPAHGERGIRLHYLMWQHKAAREARRLCASTEIDVVHHFSLGTVKAPPHLQKIPVPVVWGPMGGGQTMPPGFARYFKGQLTLEYLRVALAKVLPLMPSLRGMARKSAVVLANNYETVDMLRAAGARHVDVFLETAIPASALEEQVPARHDRQELNVLWAGRLERRKTLLLALEALAQTRMPIRMRIAGDGPVRAELEAQARRLGLGDRAQFIGRAPFAQMAQLFRDADVFLFTSLRDSTGSVVLEAAARGLPVLALDHQGMRAILPDSASIKIPVQTPEQVTRQLAEAMDELARSPERRQSLAAGALAWARENTWEKRAIQMAGFYEKAMALEAGNRREG